MKLMPELKLSFIETKHTASSRKLHKSVIRASGDVVLPDHIAQYIQLVTGLTELRGDTKYRVQKYSTHVKPSNSKRNNNMKGTASSSSSETVGVFTNFTDVVITPRVIRSLYSVPGGKLGAGIVADSSKSKHGNNGKNTIKNRYLIDNTHIHIYTYILFVICQECSMNACWYEKLAHQAR
jgi:hypothetical protein